jgi:hypothetical protein
MRPAAEARAIIESAYTQLFGSPPPWAATYLLLAQSRGEGRWGSFGGEDALGDHYGENWGAVQAKMGPPCPPGTFEAGDSKPTSDGQKPFRWCFKGYSTPVEGAMDFLRHALVYRPRAAKAVLTGDPVAYTDGLYNDGNMPYFGGFCKTPGCPVSERKQSYVDMLTNNGKEAAAELGMPVPQVSKSSPAAPTGKTAARGAPLLLLALGGGAAAYFLVRK